MNKLEVVTHVRRIRNLVKIPIDKACIGKIILCESRAGGMIWSTSQNNLRLSWGDSVDTSTGLPEIEVCLSRNEDSNTDRLFNICYELNLDGIAHWYRQAPQG